MNNRQERKYEELKAKSINGTLTIAQAIVYFEMRNKLKQKGKKVA